MVENRNTNAVVLFWHDGKDPNTFSDLGLGDHLTRNDVVGRCDVAIKQAGFTNPDQRVGVYGHADVVGSGILGAMGLGFHPPVSAEEAIQFTHALVGDVGAIKTVDVCRVPERGESEVINRVSMSEIAVIASALSDRQF